MVLPLSMPCVLPGMEVPVPVPTPGAVPGAGVVCAKAVENDAINAAAANVRLKVMCAPRSVRDPPSAASAMPDPLLCS
jgi:hypothetical protein